MAAVATPVMGSNDIPTYHQIPETKYERKKLAWVLLQEQNKRHVAYLC